MGPYRDWLTRFQTQWPLTGRGESLFAESARIQWSLLAGEDPEQELAVRLSPDQAGTLRFGEPASQENGVLVPWTFTPSDGTAPRSGTFLLILDAAGKCLVLEER